MDSRKYYAIKNGRKAPIIFREWEFCQAAIHEFPKAKYKSFKTLELALNYLKLEQSQVTIIEDTVISNSSSSSSPSQSLKKPYQIATPKSIKIISYTDGSCTQLGTSRALAGAGVHFPELDVNMSFPVPGTQTNNRAELWAVIQAIEFVSHLPGPPEVDIRLDSKYVMNNLESNNVDNLDLWKELFRLLKEVKVSWTKVIGHSGDVGNDRADVLAKSVAKTSSHKLFAISNQ